MVALVCQSFSLDRVIACLPSSVQVIFGAPGTLVTSNTIITRTRMGLGAINMVDYGPRKRSSHPFQVHSLFRSTFVHFRRWQLPGHSRHQQYHPDRRFLPQDRDWPGRFSLVYSTKRQATGVHPGCRGQAKSDHGSSRQRRRSRSSWVRVPRLRRGGLDLHRERSLIQRGLWRGHVRDVPRSSTHQHWTRTVRQSNPTRGTRSQI